MSGPEPFRIDSPVLVVPAAWCAPLATSLALVDGSAARTLRCRRQRCGGPTQESERVAFVKLGTSSARLLGGLGGLLVHRRLALAPRCLCSSRGRPGSVKLKLIIAKVIIAGLVGGIRSGMVGCVSTMTRSLTDTQRSPGRDTALLHKHNGVYRLIRAIRHRAQPRRGRGGVHGR